MAISAEIGPTDTLDCGHPGWKHERVGLTSFLAKQGVARDRDGRTMCYPCAHERELADMAAADTHVAYVTGTGRITDWPGGTLGTVLESHTGGSYGHRKTYVTVRDTTGAVWYGSGPADGGNYVTLHRAKPSGRLARRYARPNGENHG